jgi:hypothetical protein
MGTIILWKGLGLKSSQSRKKDCADGNMPKVSDSDNQQAQDKEKKWNSEKE